SGDGAYEEVLAELLRVEPTEIVADLPAGLRATIAGTLEGSGTRVTTSTLRVVDDRQRPSFGGFSLDESLAIARAVDALGDFIKRTGVSNGERPTATPRLYRRQHYVAIDPATRKHLELTSTQGRNPRATLLATLDRCVTTMGSRLLARWIWAPLVDTGEIAQRADAIEALALQHARREAIREILKGTFDLERIAQKIRYRRTTPRDLASLRRTLELLPALRQLSLPAVACFFERIGEFDGLLLDLQRTLVEDPPAQIGDGGAIRPQAGSELAECVALRSDTRTRLSQLEERERELTGIKGLKIKYASPFGYAIEVAKSYAAAVPEHYVRKQTLVSGERYITAELKELEVAISNAKARQERLEAELFAALVDRAAGEVERLHDAADAIAHIDVLAALAQCAAERAYVRPTFVDESTIAVEDGRHPVMEAILQTGFVPNDLSLRESQHRFILLTGPNMGGKSTFLRQAGLLTIMAQIGSFVPAKRMELGVVDRVFTRIGAGDDLASGQSTFYMEMAEAANILRRSTARSLLLIDEVGRGTGTLDGLAIAQAICEFLLSLEEQAPLVLFATHFHELCALAEHWTLVANYHITAVENTARGGAPVFSHRVQPGSSSRSFGIEVARMAGLPDAIIERAQEIADALSGEADVEARVPLKKKMLKRPPPERQLSLLN
ncbi:MAG: DNA mismatch repair protein MutS, partial [Candidatus Eremiobacteraeota bacterium]|nr:DNA mismatch repair protein MutS [Candidatus Eremiobacteraeota bacterium]